MKYKTVLLVLILALVGCKSKLKVYNQHALLKPIKRDRNNSYTKDFSGTNERLKGDWAWGSGSDSLILRFTPIYKKKYDEKIFGYKNAFYDTNKITYRYVKNSEVLVDTLEDVDKESCLYANHLEVITTMFNVYDKCNIGGYSPPVLLFAGNNLVLVNKWSAEEGIFFEKKGEYQITIPRTITLKRLGGTSP